MLTGNVCRDFSICFSQNILDQGDIQGVDLKFFYFAFMWLFRINLLFLSQSHDMLFIGLAVSFCCNFVSVT